MHYLINEDLETCRHSLLTAELSQHLERGGGFWINIAEVIGVTFNFTITLLIKSRAEHQYSIVSQHVILENFGKGKKACL